MTFTWLKRLWPRRHREPPLSVMLRGALESLTTRLKQQHVDHALIGGVAVAMHGYVRATRDLDFLVAASDAEKAHAVMTAMGFVALQRNQVFANYALGPLRVDLLLTQAEHSKSMLRRATPAVFRSFQTKLVDPAGIIGLKLQALDNNPSRPNDASDIRELLRLHHQSVDIALVRDYFRLFGKEAELDAILKAL